MLQRVVELNPRITEQELRAFTNRHGIRLPKQYEEFLLRNNGGEPSPPAFPISGFENNPSGVVQVMFGLNAKFESLDLDKVLSEHESTIPKGILPIACTEGYDLLVLDLRSPHAPVLYWDRRPFWGNNVWDEDDLYFVANDFPSFLQGLHEFDR